jgi:hypothetical protein
LNFFSHFFDHWPGKWSGSNKKRKHACEFIVEKS